MLDIKFIRENKDIVIAGAKKKHLDVDINALLKLDDERRELLQAVEKKKETKNKASDRITKGVTDKERYKLIDEMKLIKGELQTEEDKLRKVMKKWQTLMLKVPNIPDMSVQEGKDDSDNK